MVEFRTHCRKKFTFFQKNATLSVCHGTLRATGGNSCCTRPMEDEFLLTAPEYLHEHIQMSNEVLKAKITQSDAKFRGSTFQIIQETLRKYNISKLQSRSSFAFFRRILRL
ncbi:hypothetical protein RRG08_034935 [Elysia crispata]|uniref:Uncharacterized protein n=1 Tax=Elysia crispata TaxID=231223 RepID=A0AAE1CRD9_9GAST|nr:hypothetical protein RRG08_034935 [Elysia crispata]